LAFSSWIIPSSSGHCSAGGAIKLMLKGIDWGKLGLLAKLQSFLDRLHLVFRIEANLYPDVIDHLGAPKNLASRVQTAHFKRPFLWSC